MIRMKILGVSVAALVASAVIGAAHGKTVSRRHWVAQERLPRRTTPSKCTGAAFSYTEAVRKDCVQGRK